MRLSAIADRLAALEGRDADEIHIKLRNPLLKSLLSGEAGRGRNSPSDFAPEELVRARLLLALADCGLSTADLEQVNVELRKPPSSSGSHPESAADSQPFTTARCTKSRSARRCHRTQSRRDHRRHR